MTEVLVFLVVVTVAAFFAGFRMDRTIWRRWGQASFFVGLGLIAFTAYFVWREHRTVSELARLVDPVPKITQVTYAPSPLELQVMARTLAAVPGHTATGTTQEERRATARRVETLNTRYWLLRTALRTEEVMSFYGEPQHRKGWNVKTQEGAWITLEGAAGSLTIFAAEDWPRPGTRVIYIYKGA